MMRKILFFILFFAVSVEVSFADEQIKVILDNDRHTSETIKKSFCNIFVTFDKYEEGKDLNVTVELENLSETNPILLFKKSYNEKELKKLPTSIRYDKTFPGSKGERIIDCCPIVKNDILVLPSRRDTVIIISKSDSGTVNFSLPLYIAKPKGKKFALLENTPIENFLSSKWKKLMLLEMKKIEIEVTLKLKPDEDYIRLNNKCDSLLNEISKTTFCTNRRHKGQNATQLKKKYEESITSLKYEIDDLTKSRGYFSSDTSYKMFHSITQKLDSVDFESLSVSSCEYDRKLSTVSRHKCKYCNLSNKEIYGELDKCYTKLRSGNLTKAQAKNYADALFKCSEENRSRKQDYKKRIIEYYNAINSYDK